MLSRHGESLLGLGILILLHRDNVSSAYILARPPKTAYNLDAGNRRVCDNSWYAHFLTFSYDRRGRLLDHDHPKWIVLGVRNEQLGHTSATCVGFVVMPDHVHAIVWFPECGLLSQSVHEWKRRSSYHIRDWYRAGKAHDLTGSSSGIDSGNRRILPSRSSPGPSWRSRLTRISTRYEPVWSSGPWDGSGVRHLGKRRAGRWAFPLGGCRDWSCPTRDLSFRDPDLRAARVTRNEPTSTTPRGRGWRGLCRSGEFRLSPLRSAEYEVP